jgi:surface antigen
MVIKILKQTRLTTKLKKSALVLSMGVVAIGNFLIPYTSAMQYAHAQSVNDLKNQAKNIDDQINDGKAKADALNVQVDSLKTYIASLDGQIAESESQIRSTDQRIASLSDELVKTAAELERQRGLLRSSLRQLYKTTGASSVELVFASNDFSTFINNQEYLDKLKDGVKNSLNKIIDIKKDLEAKKSEQEQLKVGQQQRKKDLDATRVERSDVLVKTQGDEANYRSMVDKLLADQKAINAQIAALSVPVNTYSGTGSYPWANAAEGYWDMNGCYGSDPWGMCLRQCVSYTAWKVASTGRYMPSSWINGKGNARNWVSSAQEDGIPVDQTAQVGDIAILVAGYYGHAMYVEELYSNGNMRVSNYNFNFDGRYTENIMPSNRSNLYFIHFQ